MAFPQLHRRKFNRSVRADRYATEVLRKVDGKGSSSVPKMNFVIQKIKEADQGKASCEREFDLWSPMWE